MGTYIFAVDYEKKLQMWPPKTDSPKYYGVLHPYCVFSQMVAMRNIFGDNFVFINDIASHEEHAFTCVTEKVFTEYCEQYPFILEDENFYGGVYAWREKEEDDL